MSSKKARGKSFEPGDPRINRKGRPLDTKRFPVYVRKFLSETLGETDITRLDAMLRKMASSGNAQDRKELLERAFGKVKQEVDLKVSGKDVDSAIAAELARVAGRSEVEDAGTAAGDAESSAGDKPA